MKSTRSAKNIRSTKSAQNTRTVKKKKQSTFGIFIRRFISSTFWLIVLIAMGAASYKVTIAYYDAAGGPKDDKAAGIIDEYFGRGAEFEEVSKNLILSQTEDGEINHIILGVFNTITENLDYITIPADTRFTISNELYQKLCAAGSEAPQIIRLEDADQYFSESSLYGYMVILLEDMLGMDISYYTVISEEWFDRVFAETITADGTEVYKISDSFLNETKGLTDEESLKAYLKEQSKEYKSSLALKEKYEYISAYLEIKEECIYIHCIAGTRKEDCFEPDLEGAKTLIAKVADNSVPYTEAQGALTDVPFISSEGYNIEILNGSGITGLAAFYENEFTKNGFTVTHIGNYTLGTLTESRIIVKEPGMGQDLLELVGTGSVEVGELPDGVDIQVLLGTMAENH